MKKILKYIFIIIILAEIIIISYNSIAFIKIGRAQTEFKSFMAEIKRNGNIYYSYNLISDEKIDSYERFNKDGKVFYKKVKDNDDIIYLENEGKSYQINKVDKKVHIWNESNYIFSCKLDSIPIQAIQDYLLRNDDDFKFENSSIGEFDGKKCYILNFKNQDRSIILDYDTYDVIGMRVKRNKIIDWSQADFYRCEIKINTVKDSDFELPDISGYEIEEHN